MPEIITIGNQYANAIISVITITKVKGRYMRRKLLFVAICLAVFIVGALGAFFIADQLNKKQPAPAATTSPEVTNAKDMVAAIQSASLSEVSKLALQSSTEYKPMLTGLLPQSSIGVSVAAGQALLYVADDSSAVIQSDAILKEAGEIFTKSGLNAVTAPVAVEGAASYANDAVSCQVQIPQAKPATVTFACVDATDIAKEYEIIKTLIGLYDAANPTGPIDMATLQSVGRTTKSQGNITGSIVNISKKIEAGQVASGNVLLFGAIDANWEYVANLSEGKSVGKVNLSTESLALVKNQKWNGVLASLVGV